MKIVVATDSYKDCMSAAQACEIIAQVLTEGHSEISIQCCPLADGGEGTIAAFQAVQGGQWIECTVTGPLPGTQVQAGFLWIPETRTALVEMARASGLELLASEQRNPLYTTTYGTGELLCAARDHGAQKILLAVGGSATVDLGVGCAMATGWRFLDAKGEAVTPTGENLLKIQKIDAPETPWEKRIEVLCDVANPLLGMQGAAKVFAPQKGAGNADVVLLEVGLTNMAQRIAETLDIEIGKAAGGGAAGGLAAGAAAFLKAELTSGVDFILEQTGTLSALHQADWVITGEGSLDEQSLNGKVVSGVVDACREKEIPVTVFAGCVALSEGNLHRAGIHDAVAISPREVGLSQALAQGAEFMAAAVKKWADTHLKTV